MRPPFFWWPRNRIVRRLWFVFSRLWYKLYDLATTRRCCDGRYVLWRDVGLWWDRQEADFLPSGVDPREPDGHKEIESDD